MGGRVVLTTPAIVTRVLGVQLLADVRVRRYFEFLVPTLKQ